MKQYFDFNSFEKSIRKSLFEGIDLDDETEDAQFEKPTIQHDLFKQEQFRTLMHSILLPITSNAQNKIHNSCFGSYIKDGQKHYTYIICVTDCFNLPNNFMFDYCFETNNLIIYESWQIMIYITYFESAIIAECKYPVNIYIGVIERFNQNDDLQKIVSNAPNITSLVTSISFLKYNANKFPHKFFDKFKGFVTKYSNSKYYEMDLEKDTKGDLEIVEPSSFFEDPSDYEKFNKFRQMAIE